MAVKWFTWAVGLGLLAGCGGDDTSASSKRTNAASAMDGGQANQQSPWHSHCEQMTKYASLPLDDGPHPGNATEWWYWNAHLFTADGARYGMMFAFYQFTTGNSRAIATTLAITDVNDPNNPVFSVLSFSTPKYFRTMPNRFELEVSNDSKTMHAEGDNTQAHVSGQNNDYEVDLDVTAKKAAVMHGDHGLVEFFEGSNIYYSTTRMDATGTIKVHGESHDVTGIAWYDHEYGAQPITNWLWMSIQLENDEDLMVWRAVSLDGTGVKGGVTYVSPDCDQTNYNPSDFTLEATAEPWTSPVTKLTYDQGWHFELPDQNLALDIAPLLHDAEIRAGGSIPYWEVDADVKGTKNGQDVKGYGYSEDVHFAF